MKLPSLPDLSKLSTRERLLAAGVLFAISCTLLDRVVLGPWWRYVRRMSEEVRRLEKENRGYQRLMARKGEILAQVEAYSAYLSQIHTGSRDVASVLREIEAMGKESGISLVEVKPSATSQEEESQEPQEYVFDVQYSGSFQQWIHFVHLVQTSKSLFRVQRASLALKSPEGAALEGSMRLTLKAAQNVEGADSGTGRS